MPNQKPNLLLDQMPGRTDIQQTLYRIRQRLESNDLDINTLLEMIVVNTLNALSGDVTIAAGTNISITTAGQSITINSTLASVLGLGQLWDGTGTNLDLTATDAAVLIDTTGALGQIRLPLRADAQGPVFIWCGKNTSFTLAVKSGSSDTIDSVNLTAGTTANGSTIVTTSVSASTLTIAFPKKGDTTKWVVAYN